MQIRGIDIIDILPKGWCPIRDATTVPNGYVLVTNNKSHFGGERKIALIREEKLKESKKGE